MTSSTEKTSTEKTSTAKTSTAKTSTENADVDKAAVDSASEATVDTVADRSGTPDTEQPSAELVLTAAEYARMREIRGRPPHIPQPAMDAVMCTEHCSITSTQCTAATSGRHTC